MSMECFRRNMNNSISDAVRRGLLELDKMSTGTNILRLTPEFDELIQIPSDEYYCKVDGDIYPTCDIDNGNEYLCKIAEKLKAEGKTKFECKHWIKKV